MQTTIKQIAEAFSRHSFEMTYPHLRDDIRWNLVGDTTLVGKESVMAACNQSATYLASISTTFRKFQVIAEGNCIVIDTISDYLDENNETTTVYS